MPLYMVGIALQSLSRKLWWVSSPPINVGLMLNHIKFMFSFSIMYLKINLSLQWEIAIKWYSDKLISQSHKRAHDYAFRSNITILKVIKFFIRTTTGCQWYHEYLKAHLDHGNRKEREGESLNCWRNYFLVHINIFHSFFSFFPLSKWRQTFHIYPK